MISILTSLNAEHGITLLMVTHDANIAHHCQRIIYLKDGKEYKGRLEKMDNNTVSFRIDETGKVEDVKVVDAAPAGVFDESAMDAFKQGKFAPAQKSGRAVKSLMEIKVWFKLD